MIPLTPDAPDIPKWLPPEHCCFCAAKTTMWYRPQDVAVCETCAKTREPHEVPTKDQWCESPQGRGISEDRIISRFQINDTPVMLYRDLKGLYHVDFGKQRDAHGAMTADQALSWTTKVIGNLLESMKTAILA